MQNNNNNNSNKCKKLKEKIITNFLNELRVSNYYQVDFKNSFDRCLRELDGRKIERIICYGLGSFYNGVDITSRYQLALLLLIYEFLTEKQDNFVLSPIIEIYDPSFDNIDKNTLELFTSPKFSLISDNEYCAKKITTSIDNSCALIYMPHLDKYLYNNLLGANWSHENLTNLLILGNSFREMIESETLLKCQNELYYLWQLVCNFEISDKTKHSNNQKKKSYGKQSNKLVVVEKKNERDQPEKEKKEQVLVEIDIDDKSFQYSDIFNSFSFQFINNSWMMCNYKKIQRYSLAGWTCVTSQPSDEWDN